MLQSMVKLTAGLFILGQMFIAVSAQLPSTMHPHYGYDDGSRPALLQLFDGVSLQHGVLRNKGNDMVSACIAI